MFTTSHPYKRRPLDSECIDKVKLMMVHLLGEDYMCHFASGQTGETLNLFKKYPQTLIDIYSFEHVIYVFLPRLLGIRVVQHSTVWPECAEQQISMLYVDYLKTMYRTSTEDIQHETIEIDGTERKEIIST